MAIWAIADLHLSFGVPNKKMDVFGERWVNHEARVEHAWRERIQEDDLVLIPGDISWAKELSQAAIDLNWIHRLPGTKLLLRGNHDYWWQSLKSIATILPSSMHLIQNNAFNWQGVSIGGARLWDTPEYSFDGYIELQERPGAPPSLYEQQNVEEEEKIFRRELGRLEMSLRYLDQNASMRLAMTHYPPIGPDLKPSRASELLSKFNVNTCVFGHLHNVPSGKLPFGMVDGVRYILTACDYIDCVPVQIA